MPNECRCWYYRRFTVIKIPLCSQSQSSKSCVLFFISYIVLGLKSIHCPITFVDQPDLDSSFGYVPSVVALILKGLYAPTLVQKHAPWKSICNHKRPYRINRERKWEQWECKNNWIQLDVLCCHGIFIAHFIDVFLLL